MKLQFQLTPADLRNARKALGMPIYNLTFVASCLFLGFSLAIPLLIYAQAVGLLIFIGIVFAIGYIRMALRISRARRKLNDIQTSVTLNEHGIQMHQNSCEQINTWTKFQEIVETSRLIVLRVNEAPIPLPKQSMTPEQTRALHETIERFTDPNAPHEDSVDLFEQMNQEKSNPVYNFAWNQVDRLAMSRSRLRPFSRHSSRPDLIRIWGMQIILTLLATVIVLAMTVSTLYLLFSQEYDWDRTRSALIVLGGTIPILLAFGADRIQRYLSKRWLRTANFPLESVSVCLASDAILMGTANAFSKYALVDILEFYCSSDFVGFQLYDGFVHAWPARAFGSTDASLNFLRNAERRRNEIQHQRPGNPSAPVTSDNPYQSPRNT